MPRLVHQLPKYRKHASGQAVVTLNNHDVYLGEYGNATSRREYNRLTVEWLARGRTAPTTAAAASITVVELIAAYWTFAKGYYRHADGSPTGEVDCIRSALRPMKKLYGDTLATDFGPLALAALRAEMIKLGWVRTFINKQVYRIKRMFRWAVAQELVPAAIFEALRAVDGLREGRSDARESARVLPAPEAQVEAILPLVAPPVKAMIELQLLTGMRPGETVIMRSVDLDTSGPVWLYKPERHKGQHRGIARVIYLGKRAQEIVKPYLRTNTSEYLFRPADGAAWHRQQRRERRKTPAGYGNTAGSNCKAKPSRVPGERYTPNSYAHAIKRACEKAYALPAALKEPVTPKQKQGAIAAGLMAPERIAERRAARSAWRNVHTFHPHQLRHSAATRLRRGYGLEAARTILGHQNVTMTELYAEQDLARAQQIMSEVG
jgi:integrase